MAQFQVPQFIDTEDKIIGPLSIKQFGFVAISTAIAGVLFFVFEFWLAAVIGSLIMAMAFSFALIKINGRGLGALAFSALKYYWIPQSYIFKSHGRTRGAALTVKPGGLKDIGERLLTSKMSIPKREESLAAGSASDSQQEERYELIRKISGDKEAARRIDYR